MHQVGIVILVVVKIILAIKTVAMLHINSNLKQVAITITIIDSTFIA